MPHPDTKKPAPPKNPKLTGEQVLEARSLHYQKGISFAQLARTFDVSRSTIRAAVVGDTWKSLPIAYKRPTMKDV